MIKKLEINNKKLVEDFKLILDYNSSFYFTLSSFKNLLDLKLNFR